MKFLVFDTETTGKPRFYNAPMTNLNNWPRVIQLSFVQFDDNGKVIDDYNKLIKPDGWVMPTDTFWIENGFSQEKSMAEGIPIAEAIDAFIAKINISDLLVAHNMSFDYNVLGAEMIRLKKRADKRLKQICTMNTTIEFCQLPGKYGYKYPKLEELHIKLFGYKFEGAHDALMDTMACGKCFFELIKRNIIKIPNQNN
jgi:DNA polymerase III epsilon subunit-like protein